jgi:hypothetical protein
MNKLVKTSNLVFQVSNCITTSAQGVREDKFGERREICRISEGCNGFVLPENLTNTALGYVHFHTLIITVYCDDI